MYAIHHRRFYHSKDDRVVMRERIATLAEARDLRVVSGDLVVYQKTSEVVVNDEWLWDWEKAKDECYARRAINSVKVDPNIYIGEQYAQHPYA